MKFFIDFFKGVLIGSGAILPGISSGVFCIIFGIYEKLIDIILNFFKGIKKNFTFLLPLLLGGIVGVLIFSKILNYLLITFPLPTKFCFIGLVLGSIPILIKKANNNNKFHLHYLIYLLSAFFIGLLFIKLKDILPFLFTTKNTNFFYLTIVGIVMSTGIVVPGVSSTVILMIFGIYSQYLDAISNINLSFLFPLGIGIIIGGFIWLKIINYLFKHYHCQTFYTIIGFVIGSVLILYSNISFNLNGILSIISLCFGLSFGYFFTSIEEK